MELTDNDRQRIEQAAKLAWKNTITAFEDSDEISFWEGYLTGAEYATLYERQQQEEQLEKAMNTVRGLEELYANTSAKLRDLQKEYSDTKANLHRAYNGLEGYKALKEQIQKLEAERSELINLLTEYVNDTGAVQTNRKARAEQLLNSLKK